MYFNGCIVKFMKAHLFFDDLFTFIGMKTMGNIVWQWKHNVERLLGERSLIAN